MRGMVPEIWQHFRLTSMFHLYVYTQVHPRVSIHTHANTSTVDILVGPPPLNSISLRLIGASPLAHPGVFPSQIELSVHLPFKGLSYWHNSDSWKLIPLQGKAHSRGSESSPGPLTWAWTGNLCPDTMPTFPQFQSPTNTFHTLKKRFSQSTQPRWSHPCFKEDHARWIPMS